MTHMRQPRFKQRAQLMTFSSDVGKATLGDFSPRVELLEREADEASRFLALDSESVLQVLHPLRKLRTRHVLAHRNLPLLRRNPGQYSAAPHRGTGRIGVLFECGDHPRDAGHCMRRSGR